jgi:hypothetical protein
MSSRFLRPLLGGAAMALAACGASTSGNGNGTLAVALTDAPSPDVRGIVVTVDSVTAHSDEAGWVTVAQGPITVDLLSLQNVSMKLGEISLPAGTVSEVRLILVDGGPQYVVLADGSHAPLKTPSGAQSGEKLEGPFTVSACERHTLTIDFDGKNSIAYHQTGGPNPEWILRPVIRVKTEADEVLPCHADGGAPGSGPPPSGPGTDGGTDAGSDAGTPPGPDAGTPDGGLIPPPPNLG